MSRPLVLAMVGTDHHPFDRMVDWADGLARTLDEVDVLVQHGATHAPAVATGREFLSRTELDALLGRASVVICHGGPGTITDARDAGHVPLCLARDPGLGEHVDGHQMRFVATVAAAGVVVCPHSAAELLATVRGWLDAVDTRPVASRGDDRAVATSRFAWEARDLLSSPARRRDPFLRSLRGLLHPLDPTPRADRAPERRIHP